MPASLIYVIVVDARLTAKAFRFNTKFVYHVDPTSYNRTAPKCTCIMQFIHTDMQSQKSTRFFVESSNHSTNQDVYEEIADSNL